MKLFSIFHEMFEAVNECTIAGGVLVHDCVALIFLFNFRFLDTNRAPRESVPRLVPQVGSMSKESKNGESTLIGITFS